MDNAYSEKFKNLNDLEGQYNNDQYNNNNLVCFRLSKCIEYVFSI